jgi:hypothetical protein
VPEYESEVIILFALFRELEEGSLSRFRVQKVYDEDIDVVLVIGDGQARAQSVGKGMGIVDELGEWGMRSGMCDGGGDGGRGVCI